MGLNLSSDLDMRALIDAVRAEPAIMTVVAQDGNEVVVMRRLMEDTDEPDYGLFVACAMHTGNQRCLFELVSYANARHHERRLGLALLDCCHRVHFNPDVCQARQARPVLQLIARRMPRRMQIVWRASPLSSAYH